MGLSFTDEQLHATAVEHGLIGPKDELPRSLRSRAARLLMDNAGGQDQQTPAAGHVLVTSDGLEVDGRPFPWALASRHIEVVHDPEGLSTVRLTMAAKAVEIHHPNRDEGTRA